MLVDYYSEILNLGSGGDVHPLECELGGLDLGLRPRWAEVHGDTFVSVYLEPPFRGPLVVGIESSLQCLLQVDFCEPSVQKGSVVSLLSYRHRSQVRDIACVDIKQGGRQGRALRNTC